MADRPTSGAESRLEIEDEQRLGIEQDTSAGAPNVTSNKRESVCSGCDLLQAEKSQIGEQLGRKLDINIIRSSEKPKSDAKTGEQTKWWLLTRIHVALLGLAIAAVNCYAQATFCIAIVEMVLPADYTRINQTTSLTTNDLQLRQISNNSSLFVQTHKSISSNDADDESCPIEFKYRRYYDSWRFPSTPTAARTNATAGAQLPPIAPNSQMIDVTNRFDWDASQQGLLLGAFAFGTAPLQVVGGRLAELYGAKWVLLAGCIGTALTNMSIPYIAHWSFGVLLLNRVLMGVAQAGMEPGLMCFLAEWLTPNEASFFISMLLFAICVGFFLGSLLSSFILALGYGWPLAYYVSGGLNLLVGLVWLCYADSWPRVSKHISSSELEYIEREQLKQVVSNNGSESTSLDSVSVETSDIVSVSPALVCNDKTSCKLGAAVERQQVVSNNVQQVKNGQQSPAPWLTILSTRSVWAFIICKISIRWCADVLSNELPTYLANVLHLSIEINGILNSVSSALFAIFSFLTGWLVNEISSKATANNNNNNSNDQDNRLENKRAQLRRKTNLRKVFQSSASFGSALAVFLMTRYDCNLLFSMSMLLVLSCCLVMGTGGELQIPYDMTTRYPGTLHGMACTMSVSGWLAPPLIGLILGERPSSRARWHTVWYLTATINLIGGLVFVLFADASPRDFDSKKARSAVRQPESRHATLASTAQRDDECAASYANAACSPPSTCNNSPKDTRASMVAKAASESAPSKPTKQPELYSDEQLIRVRQSSDSFVATPASYGPAHMSFSPLANVELMFAFQDKRRLDEPVTLAASCEPRPGNSWSGNKASALLGNLWRRARATDKFAQPAAGHQQRQQRSEWRRQAGANDGTITHL